MLKFGAINLDHRVGIAEEYFRGGFDRACFARASWPQEEQRANWLARQRKLCQIELVELREREHGVVLRYYPRKQFLLEDPGLITPLPGIERHPFSRGRHADSRFHCFHL